jgi:FtsH-binding integral membrane protein
MLLSRSRAQVLAGLALTAIAEGGLAAALIPGRDLKLLVSPPLHLAALVCGLLVVCGGAAAFVRYPVVVPIALLAAAPFRISVSIGSQKAYLLLPLYAVLASAMLALLVRAVRTREARHLPALLAVPAATFVLLAGVSLTWTRDLRQGTIELLFFLFPFSALVIAVASSHSQGSFPRSRSSSV